MSGGQHPVKQGNRAKPRRGDRFRFRLVFLILMASLSLLRTAWSQETDADAVERLRDALQASYPTPAVRDRVIKHSLDSLRSLDDLQRAALLIEWREAVTAEAVDQANYEQLLKRFHSAVRQILRGDDAAAAAVMIDRLGEMAAEVRGSGGSVNAICPFGPDLAELVSRGATPLRAVAARTLIRIEPPISVAVPALGELLQAQDAELRRIAADGFADWMQNALQTAGGGDSGRQWAGRRGELILMASRILPAVHRGLDDARPEVRRRCLETVGLAAAALTRLLESAPGQREPRTERSELGPLVLALREQGPMLIRTLGDSDGETRLRTFKVLEELGRARTCWLQRCPPAEGDPLGEVLIAALPGLAAALRHPEARVRCRALDAVEMCGPLALPIVPALMQALHDRDRFVRWSAVRIAGKLGSAAPQITTDLQRLLQDPDVDLRRAAAAALTRFRPAASAGGLDQESSQPR